MKLLYITVLFCALSSAASAQMQDRVAESPVERRLMLNAEEATRQMASRLSLNEAQYVRLRTVNQIRLVKLDEIEWQYSQNCPERQARIVELESEYEQECRRILTPSQIVLLRDEDRHDAVPKEATSTGNGLG